MREVKFLSKGAERVKDFERSKGTGKLRNF